MRAKKLMIGLLVALVISGGLNAYALLGRKQIPMGNWVFSEILGKIFVVERPGKEPGIALYLYRQQVITLFKPTGGLGRYETTLLEWKSFVDEVNMIDKRIDKYLGLEEEEKDEKGDA